MIIVDAAPVQARFCNGRSGLALIVCVATIEFGCMMRNHGMTIEKFLVKAAAASVLAFALAACDGSSRFSDFGGSRQAVAPPPPRAQTFTPAPTGRVDSTPLPPPGGGTPGANPALGGLPPAGPGGVTATPGIPPIGSTVPIDPEPPRAPTRQIGRAHV